MKPQPRRRSQPQRFQRTSGPPASQKQLCRWQRAEQIQLLSALQRLGKTTAGGQADLDYVYLKERVPSRSASEIRSVVEDLKAKVISCAHISLRTQTWKQKKDRKPIEEWTDMASAVSGTLDNALSSAFSQMLMVSSTEPRTLTYSEPPQNYRPPTDRQKPPPPPSAPLSVPGELSRVRTSAGGPPILIIKAPAPSKGPAQRLLQISPTQLHVSPSEPGTSRCQPTVPPTGPRAGDDPITLRTLQHPATSQRQPAEAASSLLCAETTAASSNETITTSSTHPSKFSSSTANTHSSSSSSSSSAPTPSLTPSSLPSPLPTPPSFSTPTAALHATFGRMKACPRGRTVVNFEKIYHFLSVVNKEDEECSLTAMESAIVLDLLMSLPEELPLLDCNKLQRHFLEVYRCLSAPAGSKMAAKMFKGLEPEQERSDKHAAASRQKGPVTGPNPQQDRDGDTHGVADGRMNPEGRTADGGTERLFPPLNPFMVPLDLLKRQ